MKTGNLFFWVFGRGKKGGGREGRIVMLARERFSVVELGWVGLVMRFSRP